MIVELEQEVAKLQKLEEDLEQVAQALHLSTLAQEIAELQEEMAQPEIWQNPEKAQQINQKLKNHTDTVEKISKLRRGISDSQELVDLLQAEEDGQLFSELKDEIRHMEEEVYALHLRTLLHGEYDEMGAILTLHAGAGGTEAQDWTQMLERMYLRFCERHAYQVKVTDLLPGDEAGIKSVTMEVTGLNAYGYLKAEKGVHRLVRISPFDASARRHTSFASLDVIPILEDDTVIEIRTEDLRIDTFRATGAGGQHINRTDSAVRITHLPTGIVVTCQNERSQVQNKEVCMRMLRSRLAELKEREQMEKMASIQGELKKIEWGSQIRSYVFHPYSMVKDHRTSFETANVNGIMDGELDDFITAYLKMI